MADLYFGDTKKLVVTRQGKPVEFMLTRIRREYFDPALYEPVKDAHGIPRYYIDYVEYTPLGLKTLGLQE